MNQTEQKRFRKIVDKLVFRKAMPPRYWDCPHEYIVAADDPFLAKDAPWSCPEKQFDFLDKMIATYGEEKPWRTRRDVVLINGRFVYWGGQEIGVINRTYRESVDFKGYLPPHVLVQFRKRFWPTQADRKLYAQYPRPKYNHMQ
jgi:hypothetical protein